MITFLYLMLCFMLPNIVWQLLNRKRLMRRKNAIRHIVWTYIFWVYCALAIHVAGIGTIWDLISYKEVVGGFNFIPFSSEGIATYILNMIMLVPLGFLLPFIWKEFRTIKKVCLAGLGFSLLIEFFQIFSRRVSNIDDLLMNTLGTCVGYLIWILYCRLFGRRGKSTRRRKKTTAFHKTEPVKYVLMGFVGVFLLYNWRPLDAALFAHQQGNDVSIHDSATGSNDLTTETSRLSDEATIVCNDGTVEKWNCNDLLNLYHENPEVFEERYDGAKISFVDIPRSSGLNSLGDDSKMYRSLIFANGWRVEFAYEGYEFIDQADKEGREIIVSVESFISGVWEYESGMFMIVLGSWDESLIGETVITEVK